MTKTRKLQRVRITAAILSLLFGLAGWITDVRVLFYVGVFFSIVWIAAVIGLADHAVKGMTK
jgi:hypothetical protein